MANLKDINYGIGKYLEASDASDIPDIGTNRTNINLLNFKVATNNAYALYNFKDGMIDDFQDTSGVDASASTNEARDSSGKYYSGSSVEYPTSGTVTTYTSGGTTYRSHYFSSNGNFVATVPGTVDMLLVAGGGGSAGGGGGGAGGVRVLTGVSVSAATHSITIGAGGSWNNSGTGKGGTTTALSQSTTGGGGGAGSGTPASGRSGGSGGGGRENNGHGGGAGNQGSYSPVEGYAGGTGGNTPGHYTAGGGGGGASGTGGNAGGGWGWAGGSGGNGIQNDYKTGSNIYYGGGGGGGMSTTQGGTRYGGGGGNGGGGRGWGASGSAQAGTDGFGGGAGGGQVGPATYLSGGSGACVIRYPTTEFQQFLEMTIISTTQTANAEPDEGRLMIYEETSTGSTTLDTDLKGYVSRDGGTTYTQTPLALDSSITHPTSLLLHCDGSNGGTTFTDSSFWAHTPTVAGNTHTDTAVKKLGTASAQFDGTGDYLDYASSPAFGFGTGDWTIDFWIYASASGFGTFAIPFDFRTDGNSVGSPYLFFDTGNSNIPGFTEGSGTTRCSSNVALSNETWYHIAVVKSSNVTKVYTNGVTGASGTYATEFADTVDYKTTNPLRLGHTTSGSYALNGYLDEFRITKGIARWTANFTPDTSPYTGTEGDTRLVSGSVDISGQPAGTSMRYKIETLNQSDSKICRIHGASMLWA